MSSVNNLDKVSGAYDMETSAEKKKAEDQQHNIAEVPLTDIYVSDQA